jgi:hypothetical protein
MNAEQHSSAGRTLNDHSGRDGHADPPSERLKNLNMILVLLLCDCSTSAMFSNLQCFIAFVFQSALLLRKKNVTLKVYPL